MKKDPNPDKGILAIALKWWDFFFRKICKAKDILANALVVWFLISAIHPDVSAEMNIRYHAEAKFGYHPVEPSNTGLMDNYPSFLDDLISGLNFRLSNHIWAALRGGVLAAIGASCLGYLRCNNSTKKTVPEPEPEGMTLAEMAA